MFGIPRRVIVRSRKRGMARDQSGTGNERSVVTCRRLKIIQNLAQFLPFRIGFASFELMKFSVGGTVVKGCVGGGGQPLLYS